MKKTILSLFVAAGLISFLLASCDSGPKKQDTETKKDTTSKKELPKETMKESPKEPDSKISALEGKWVSTDDSKSVLQVKGNEWIEIYNGEKPEITKFATGDSCLANDKAKTNPKGKYITVFDNDEIRCFYIVNVNDSKLELSYVGRGNTLTYKKKK
ncbi:MAG: hypothetical protein WCK13_03905 [Ignavibacteriota bacterium]|nr:hypothetical protein [Ignavibacteriota bacterium]